MISLEYSRSGKVATITLNRPEQRNALNQRMAIELERLFKAVSRERNVRIVVLTGAGTVFSAGADLKALMDMKSATVESNQHDSRLLADLFATIRRCPHPVIARINGHAIAGGMGLVTACDFAVADERARFGFPETRIGFIPAIVMTFLRNRIPDLLLRDMLLRGALISAHDAVGIHLISRAVDGGRLDDAVEDLVCELLRETSREAIARTKQLLVDLDERPTSEWLKVAVDANARMRHTDDCRAGIGAFLAGEDPPWKKEYDRES